MAHTQNPHLVAAQAQVDGYLPAERRSEQALMAREYARSARGKETCGKCAKPTLWWKASVGAYKCTTCGALMTSAGVYL